MNVRLVCAFASNSCIGTEPAAYVEENVESENTDFRAVLIINKVFVDSRKLLAELSSCEIYAVWRPPSNNNFGG